MSRDFGIAGMLTVALLSIAWCTARMMYPPLEHSPVSQAPVTPEPFEPPPVEPEEDYPPLVTVPALTMVDVCCCGRNVYEHCVPFRMVRLAAQQHAARHTHDLIGRGCPDERDEDWQLRRVLERPEQIHRNTRNRLSMSDRAARRERMKAEAD